MELTPIASSPDVAALPDGVPADFLTREFPRSTRESCCDERVETVASTNRGSDHAWPEGYRPSFAGVSFVCLPGDLRIRAGLYGLAVVAVAAMGTSALLLWAIDWSPRK